MATREGSGTHAGAAAQSPPDDLGTRAEEVAISAELRQSLTGLIQKHPDGIWINEFQKLYKKEHGESIDHRSSRCRSTLELLALLPSIFKVVPAGETENKLMLFPASAPQPEMTRDTLSANVEQLLQRDAAGVPVESLVPLYKQMFGHVLDVSQMGFHSLAKFLESLDFAKLDVGASDSNSGTRHVIARFVAPSPAQPEPEERASGPSPEVRRAKQPGYIDGVLLNDRNAIAEQPLPARLGVGDSFLVETGEVISPHSFYLNIKGARTTEALDSLMRRMDTYYKAPGDMSVPTMVAPVGNFFAAEYGSDGYHRVFATRMRDPERVDIYYVDYGTRETKAVTDLRLLHEDFASLPAQAIQARLAGIRPRKRAKQFDLEVSGEFFKLIKMCNTQRAVLKGARREGARTLLSLEMYVESGNGELCVNEVLVQMGLAEVVDDDLQHDVAPASLGLPGAP